MNKTVWKSESEINQILDDYTDLGILSCGTCANLSWTGGKTGLDFLKVHLRKNNKNIKLSKVILACCPQEIMRQAVKTNKKALNQCEALIVLSCAAGIKSANSCISEIPVITVLDSVGSAAVSCSDPILAHSLCRTCGHCVLTCTAGICPLSECPAKSKYGPCKLFSETNLQCAVDTQKDCIWHVIRQRSKNIQLLPTLRDLHQREEPLYTQTIHQPARNGFWRIFFAWHASRLQKLEWVIRQFR